VSSWGRNTSSQRIRPRDLLQKVTTAFGKKSRIDRRTFGRDSENRVYSGSISFCTVASEMAGKGVPPVNKQGPVLAGVQEWVLLIRCVRGTIEETRELRHTSIPDRKNSDERVVRVDRRGTRKC